MKKIVHSIAFLLISCFLLPACTKKTIPPSVVQKDSLFISGFADNGLFNFLIGDSAVRGISTVEHYGDSIKKFVFTITSLKDTSQKYCSIKFVVNPLRTPASMDSVFHNGLFIYNSYAGGTGANQSMVEIYWFENGQSYSTVYMHQSDIFDMYDVKDIVRDNVRYKLLKFQTSCLVTDYKRLTGFYLNYMSGKIVIKDD
jgi:hypothetical protein